MFRHFINHTLLLFFLTLATTGVLSFFLPFRLATTRVHIAFGFGVLVLVGLHLAARARYFARTLGIGQGGKRGRLPISTLFGVLGFWALTLAFALGDLRPVSDLIEQGYEAQHRATIFRPDPKTAFQPIDTGLRVKRPTEGESELLVEIEWGESGIGNRGKGPRPQIAVWAETGAGSLIETLFVSEKTAFSEVFHWGPVHVRRADVLPIWRHRYTLVSGVAPSGEIDAYSGATPDHSFSIRRHLNTDSSPFYLYVEVNAPGDENDFYRPDPNPEEEGRTLPGLGQPSVIYGAYLDPRTEKEYYLLDLVGHGGAEKGRDGNIHYDTGHLTTSKRIVEKILVRVRYQE